MTARGKLRGHEIYYDESGRLWRYSDNDESVSAVWECRPCGECGLHNTAEGHDGCLKSLPGVINACCGHGVPADAYIMFENGVTVRGFDRIEGANRG